MPYAFWHLVQPNEATHPISAMIAGLKKEGKIKGRVAMIHPTVQLGVELHAAFLEAAKKDGLEVVFSKSYPFGSSDLQPLIREAMATNPDAFIAFSYPPDTFMITEQARSSASTRRSCIWRSARRSRASRRSSATRSTASCCTAASIRAQPGLDDYHKAHRAMFNRESEAGAVGVYAASRSRSRRSRQVGEIDRKKIRDAIASGTFQTIWGEIKFKNQLNVDPWAVGQWQNGEVVGLYPAEKERRTTAAIPEAGLDVSAPR